MEDKMIYVLCLLWKTDDNPPMLSNLFYLFFFTLSPFPISIIPLFNAASFVESLSLHRLICDVSLTSVEHNYFITGFPSFQTLIIINPENVYPILFLTPYDSSIPVITALHKATDVWFWSSTSNCLSIFTLADPSDVILVWSHHKFHLITIEVVSLYEKMLH